MRVSKNIQCCNASAPSGDHDYKAYRSKIKTSSTPMLSGFSEVSIRELIRYKLPWVYFNARWHSVLYIFILELASVFKKFCRFVSLDQKLFLLFFTITISFFTQMYAPTVDNYPDGLVTHQQPGNRLSKATKRIYEFSLLARKHVFKLREKRHSKNFLCIYFVFDQ